MTGLSATRATRVAVMGAGSWGTAFAMVLADAGCSVRLWARREEVAAAITCEHCNPGYLDGVLLPAGLSATICSSEALAGAEFVVLAVPRRSRCGRTSPRGGVRSRSAPSW